MSVTEHRKRRNLAVVENLICVCWSVQGPSVETFLKFLPVVEVPTEAWEIKGGQKQ